MKLVSYYEIPLKDAKRIATYSNWESIAQKWCDAEAKGELTRWVISHVETKPTILKDGYYYYQYICEPSNELRGRRKDVKFKSRAAKPLSIEQKNKLQINRNTKEYVHCGHRSRLNPGNVKLLGKYKYSPKPTLNSNLLEVKQIQGIRFKSNGARQYTKSKKRFSPKLEKHLATLTDAERRKFLGEKE